MIVVRWVSRNLPSPERHPHDGVIDSHDQQRQQVDQNDNYDMIPWKEHRELRITSHLLAINQSLGINQSDLVLPERLISRCYT